MEGIDYKRSFEKLVEQINFEYKWAHDKRFNNDRDPHFDNGMKFAYSSIKELSDKLVKNEFFED